MDANAELDKVALNIIKEIQKMAWALPEELEIQLREVATAAAAPVG